MGVSGALGEQEVEAFIDHFGDDDREHLSARAFLGTGAPPRDRSSPNPLLHPPPNHFAMNPFSPPCEGVIRSGRRGPISSVRSRGARMQRLRSLTLSRRVLIGNVVDSLRSLQSVRFLGCCAK